MLLQYLRNVIVLLLYPVDTARVCVLVARRRRYETAPRVPPSRTRKLFDLDERARVLLSHQIHDLFMNSTASCWSYQPQAREAAIGFVFSFHLIGELKVWT